MYGKSFVTSVIDRINLMDKPDKVIKDQINGIAFASSKGLQDQSLFKGEVMTWEFELKTKLRILQNVGLLNDENRKHFRVDFVKHSANVKGSDGDQIVKMFQLGDHAQVSVE